MEGKVKGPWRSIYILNEIHEMQVGYMIDFFWKRSKELTDALAK